MTYSTHAHYRVTDAEVAPHHFRIGTPVRYVESNRHGDRHLFRGKKPNGETIVQWLAAEEVTRDHPA